MPRLLITVHKGREGRVAQAVGWQGARDAKRSERPRPVSATHTTPSLCALITHSRVRPSGIRALLRLFCPHIPGAMIDLGRYSPSWGRNASKISPGRCHNRIKRTFAGRRVRPAAQRAAEFRAFRSRRLRN